jgi:hypothetical protein
MLQQKYEFSINWSPDGNLNLINEKRPTFTSKSHACAALGIGPKKLNKIIKTNIQYKGWLFYSEEQ